MLQDFKRLFLENGEVKMVIGFIAVFISWGFNGEYQALQAILCLIAADFLTGTHCALRTGTWNSKRAVSSAAKLGRYVMFMLVARMIDKVVPLPFASPLMDTFIAVTEAGSILENFGKMGYPVPTILLNKLKTFYEKKG